jgi:hypothetical protein
MRSDSFSNRVDTWGVIVMTAVAALAPLSVLMLVVRPL